MPATAYGCVGSRVQFGPTGIAALGDPMAPTLPKVSSEEVGAMMERWSEVYEAYGFGEDSER